ncbi:MAG TPA: ankyrin repeat domain-containing protein [Burkholderiaceae bacterium]|jgi:hypothetical protein|nr:ankyrin repeat domain-containing protein [Burkholderiaceae bacterium]
MMRLLFWVLVALDIAGLLFFFVLGLAAAGSTRTHPLTVALLMLALPAIPLVLAIWVFARSQSPLWRALSFALVAAPLAITVAAQAYNDARISANSNAQGDLTFFEQGPQRELVEAIRRNDAAAVSALLPRANVNASGMQGMTPLVIALRQLRATPTQQDVLKVLLEAGADPNKGTPYERPLEMALQTMARSGPAPVALLLARRADPNVRNTSGMPIWFAAAGHDSSVDTMALLLRHGADLHGTSAKGETVLFYAASASNWRAVLYLLERGAPAAQGRSFKGLTFREVVDEAVRERKMRDDVAGRKTDDDGLKEVVEFLRRQGGAAP